MKDDMKASNRALETTCLNDKTSAVAEMGDRLATIDMDHSV